MIKIIQLTNPLEVSTNHHHQDQLVHQHTGRLFHGFFSNFSSLVVGSVLNDCTLLAVNSVLFHVAGLVVVAGACPVVSHDHLWTKKCFAFKNRT
jgi:hypothetical protein